jgi:hypothetical protein
LPVQQFGIPGGRIWAVVPAPLDDPAPGKLELVPEVPLPVVAVLPVMPLLPEELVDPADLSRTWLSAESQHLPWFTLVDVDGLVAVCAPATPKLPTSIAAAAINPILVIRLNSLLRRMGGGLPYPTDGNDSVLGPFPPRCCEDITATAVFLASPGTRKSPANPAMSTAASSRAWRSR